MNTQTTEYVWDPLVRVFHWTLVGSFVLAWATGDEWLGLHQLAGYTIGGLVALRLLWGLVGPRRARFSDFVRPPREVFAYLGDVVRFRARRYVGHNPAGGLMIVAMLSSLALTVASGVLTLGLEEFQGPAAGLAQHVGHGFAEALEELHEFCANFTVLLVAGHLVGVLVASFQHRENLVRAMWTGRKPRVAADH